MRLLLPFLVLVLLAPAEARACGVETDCAVGARTYRIRLPEPRPDGARFGAILLAHGHRDTAANVMANEGLGAAVAALGLALVAPQSAGPGWTLPGAPVGSARDGVDEVADIGLLLDDVVARFPVDRGRIMASGFSAGGMLTWHLACQAGGLFAGFAPVSGTYWAPIPATCPTGPATILHTHGTDDPVVPLAGRGIRNARQGGLACERRRNPEGRLLEICLHPGGHELRAADVVRAWRALAALNGW
jgi:polyhydroxybutyrate depolymerase